MKFVFLCGCLEPGKDGVGDYCRRLAFALTESGNQCILISWNDTYASDILFENRGYRVHRLPASMSSKEKTTETRNRILDFCPDIISVQFVSYSFDPRGIVKGLAPCFKAVTKGFNTHIMFHELWLGAHTGATLKERFVGSLQKYYILKMLRALKPVSIHTNTALFSFLLSKQGVAVKTLPVFSNIPRKSTPSHDWIYTTLAGKVKDLTPENRKHFLVFMFFGSINPRWNYTSVIKTLISLRQKYGQEIVVCSAGKLGYGDKLWEKISTEYNTSLHFFKFGEREDGRISDLLHFADFGLSSYPDLLVEKSGSIAAMTEHGLPVVISNFDLEISGFGNKQLGNSLLIDVQELEVKVKEYPGRKNNLAQLTGVKAVAEELLNDLKV